MSKDNHESEADARILIDAMLRRAGWDPADKSQVRTEVSIAAESSLALHDAPAGIEADDMTDPRRTDYILLATNGRPLAVVESKRKRIDPYTAKQQTLPLAKRVGAPFIFLSNGEITYFWITRMTTPGSSVHFIRGATSNACFTCAKPPIGIEILPTLTTSKGWLVL